MIVSSRQAGIGIGAARVAYGVALLAYPERAQALGLRLDPSANRSGAYLARVTGSRELVLGALGAGLAGASAAKAAWRWGVLVDALDVMAVTASWRAGRHDTGSWALLAGAGAGAVAAGLHAAAG